jgi:ACT domain-containing protein
MTYYLYLIFIPIFIIILYVCIKFVYLKFFSKIKSTNEHGVEDVEEDIEEIKTFISNEIKHVKQIGSDVFDDVENKTKNGFAEVRTIFWKYFDMIFDFIKRNVVKAWHFILHFIVLFLGWLSDIFDKLYTKSRNTFLYTATKEKGSVTTFWKHLKEYKKEVEQDWKKK